MAKGRRFAVFDIDGTLIRWQLYHALADTMARQGHIKPEVYRSMKDARMQWKRRTGGGFKSYETRVIEVYETALRNLAITQLEQGIEAVFEEYKDQVYTYTRDLIARLKKENYLLLAISGSQTEIVSKIAGYYGFDDYVGTVYERTGRGFSGNKTIGSLNKDKTIVFLAQKHGCGFKESIGVGDSRSDIAMLKLVEHPIAFNPEDTLFEAARRQGWKIVLERKNMVYELEKIGKKYELVKTSSG
ncbi:MAG: HAD family hydrolase [Candidatus Saccharimonadales bacterium]